MSSQVRFSNNGLKVDCSSAHFVLRAEAGEMRGGRMMGVKMGDCIFHFVCSSRCDICDEVRRCFFFRDDLYPDFRCDTEEKDRA